MVKVTPVKVTPLTRKEAIYLNGYIHKVYYFILLIK